MAYIDPTPTEPNLSLPDADAAARAAESRRRAESVSMTVATLMDRASKVRARRTEAAESAPMGNPGQTAPVGGTRPGATTTLEESGGSPEHWLGPLGEAHESASGELAARELVSVQSPSAWATSGESDSDGSVSVHGAMPMGGWTADGAAPPDESAADEFAEFSGNLPSDDPASAGRLVRPPWRLIVVTLLIVVAFVLTARILTSGDDVSGGGQLTFPIDGRKAAVIHIDSGADSIVVGTAELGDDLAVVTTPGGEDSGVRPQAQLDGDQLRVSTHDIGDAKAGSPVQIDVQLAAGVRWDVVVDKGAKQILLALGSGEVNLVELRGGADLADLTLPKPVGEMAIRIPTGQATTALHVPANIPVKATFGSGAGRAVVDGAPQQGIAPGTTIYGANGEEGYLAAKDRYLVSVLAGVGTLSLDRT